MTGNSEIAFLAAAMTRVSVSPRIGKGTRIRRTGEVTLGNAKEESSSAFVVNSSDVEGAAASGETELASEGLSAEFSDSVAVVGASLPFAGEACVSDPIAQVMLAK